MKPKSDFNHGVCKTHVNNEHMAIPLFQPFSLILWVRQFLCPHNYFSKLNYLDFRNVYSGVRNRSMSLTNSTRSLQHRALSQSG